MKGGAIPLPGSHESATRQPRNMTKGGTGTKHTRETFHTTKQASHGSRLGVIPSKQLFRGGIESSRDVVEEEEVVVLEAVAEVDVLVDVHVDGRRSGDGSGTWCFRASVVVHGATVVELVP